MANFYGSGIFYGSGAKYVGAATTAAQGIPVDLRFYRTSLDGIYVFWWGFDPAFITPALATAGFDLQLDTVPTFDSPNLVTWTQASAITFQNGNVRKGFAVPVAARINATIQTWYARVRTHTPSFISDWSSTLTWTIPQSVQQSSAEALMESLPDYHVYGKGDLLKPVSQRNTNLWVVENMYGNQLDQAFYANYLTQTDNYVDLCVDENLYENFGVQFNFPKPNNMQYVDYRWILMNLYIASLVGGTDEAITLVAEAFTGVPPGITNVRDEDDFFLNYILDTPINSLQNGGFEFWAAGTTFVNPPYGSTTADDWSVYYFGGSPTFTISRNSSVVDSGSYSLEANVTALGGVYQLQIQNFVPNYQAYIGKTITFNVRVNTSSPNVFALIYWGTGDSAPAYHPGDGNWHTLTSTAVIPANATTIAVVVGTDPATTGIFYVDTASLTDGLDFPDGTRTHFNVTYEFVAGSMKIFKDGIQLVSGVDFIEDEAIPGFIMTVAPLFSDVLNVFYKIEQNENSYPVVFDALANAIPLTGVVTFTNQSTVVSGFGTSFLSQLAINKEITDSQGVYLGTISSIVSDTSAILVAPWQGLTEATSISYVLQYSDSQVPPPILWDKSTLAAGVIIDIFNPGNFDLV